MRKIKSSLANPVIKIDGRDEGKTFQMSVESFVNTLPASKKTDLYSKTDLNQLLAADFPIPLFIEEFKRMHKVDPITAKPIL